MNAKKESLESIFEGFDPNNMDDAGPIETKPITFWVPEELKLKYETLQTISRRKFGKLLRKVVIESIDRVNVDPV